LKRLRKAVSFIMVLVIIITGLPFQYGGTHVYAADSPTVRMAVEYFSGSNTASVTAAVYDGDIPIEGIKVNFAASFGVLDSASETTDASGQATIALSSDVSGTARINAETEGSGYESEGGASVEVTFELAEENPALREDYDYLAPELVLAGNNYEFAWNTYWDITDNLTLPLQGPKGSTISWTSDNETVLTVIPDPDNANRYIGKVTRPPYSQGGDSAILKAVLSNGSENTAKTFSLYIKSVDPTLDEKKVNDDYNWLGESVLNRGDYSGINFSDLKMDRTLYLPSEGQNGSVISWEASNETFLAVKADPDPAKNNLIGEVTAYPTAAKGDQEIVLKATITSGAVVREKIFDLRIRAVATDSERVAMDEAWLTEARVLGNNIADDVKADLYLHDEGPNGSSIQWESSDTSALYFVYDSGTYPYNDHHYIGRVKRPDSEDAPVTLKATIRYGEAVSQKSFGLVARKRENAFLAAAFDDFVSAGSSLLLNGDVSIEDASIRFVSKENGGSVFTKNKIHLEEDMSFSTAFIFSVDDGVEPPGYALGDGGFTFTLQADDNTKFGTGSEALGAAGIEPSLSVGFETSYWAEQGGIRGTYTGVKVLIDGEEFCSQNIGFPPDDTLNHAWIEYNGTEKEMEIRLALDAERPAEPSGTIAGVDLTDIFKLDGTGVIRDLYAGFTGSAGNVHNTATGEIDRIREWYFNNDSSPIDSDLYDLIDASCIALSADPAGGRPFSTVTAAVYGKYGPVPGIPVEFTTSFGSLDASTVITDWEGKASAVLGTDAAGTAAVRAVAQGGASDLIEINLAISDADIVEYDRIWLSDELILENNSALDNITEDLYLPASGKNGCDISWTSSNEDIVKPEVTAGGKGIGRVTRPTILEGDKSVTLTAEISKYSEAAGETVSVEKTFNITVKVHDSDIAAADREWLTGGMLLKDNSDLDNVTGNLWLPLEGENGSRISWISSNDNVVKPEIAGDGDCIGKVARPTYTTGDQAVKLTATIRCNTVSIDKEFVVTVKALEATDIEAVYAAYAWLTDTCILGGNSRLDSIKQDLELLTEGPEGTVISWKSTNEAIVAPDGKVTRPSLAQKDQTVTLTAEISRASEKLVRSFDIYVIAEATDAEATALDHEWLTDKQILDKNVDLKNITGNLILHSLGPMGATISWESSDPTVMATDGKVSRPSWTQGMKSITLTATVQKGTAASLQKAFYLTVLPADLTDEEAVKADTERLSALHTLGQNWSQYSITQSLSLPKTLYHGTSITWTSDNPDIISNEGIVKRPKYMEGNKLVTLTACISKRDVNASKSIEYVVLQKPDTDAPEITGTTPQNNGTDVLWNTRALKVTFDEDIKRGTQTAAEDNTLGIGLRGTGIQQISAGISGKELIITPINYMDAGLNELVIPKGAVTDMSGNPAEEFRLSFNVEQKQINKIEVVSSAPQDMERQVRLWPSISFSYNFKDIVKGSSFQNISIRSVAGRVISSYVELYENKVYLNIQEILEPGTIYEITIPAGAVCDRFENVSNPKLIRFRTETDGKASEITSTYPLDNQKDVDVQENIEVNFNGIVKAKDCRLKLTDDKGSQIKTYVKSPDAAEKGLILEPYVPLEPNTRYTVTGPYYSASDPSGLEFFSMSFTTGANALSRAGISPVSTAGSPGAPLNMPIQVEFTSAVNRGPEFDSIVITDSEGNPVAFKAEEKGEKAALMPKQALKPSEAYTVNIPAGAYKNAGGGLNDAFRFQFTTAKKLEPGSFTVNPTPVWLVKRPMIFSAAGIENVFRQSGHEITSFHWDLGNGHTSEESSAECTYNTEGEYDVVLKLTDNMGFSYETEQTVSIEGMDSKNITLAFSYGSSRYLYTDSTEDTGDSSLYKLRLSCNGGFISGENISVMLYKNGVLQENFKTITAGSNDNEYVFPFYYEGKGYLGTYELVFEWTSLTGNKVLRTPVTIHEATAKGTMRVKLYDLGTTEYFEEPDTLAVEVDGVSRDAVKEWYDAEDGYCYFVGDVQTNAWHTLKIKGWTLKEEKFFHLGSWKTAYLVGKRSKPGINNVDFEFAEENTFTFIEGVNTGKLSFRVDGDWDRLEPGYYELRTDSGKFSMKSEDPRIEFDPGEKLRAGDRLAARMVAKNGSMSPWRYLSVNVIPKPYLDFGLKLSTVFEDGKYKMSLPMIGLGDILGNGTDILDGIPLMNNVNFGINLNNLVAEGTMDEDGWVTFELNGGGLHSLIKKQKTGKSTKAVKVKSVGYEVSADVYVELYLYYDSNAGEWKTLCGIFDVMGYGGYEWTRGYELPKVGIGVDATLELGSYVGGTLIIDRRPDSKREYSGIITIAPKVGVTLQAGPDWLSVGCGIYGTIPAEVHIPTGYVQAEVDIRAKIWARCLAWSKTLMNKKLVGEHWDNGKEKVELVMYSAAGQPITESLYTSDEEFVVIPRDYLDRGSSWLAGSREETGGQGDEAEARFVKSASAMFRSAVSDNENPQIEVMKDNIYPDAKVQLVSAGDELWMLWTDDNPERSAVNRTQMMYSVLKDGVWSKPEWMDQDGTGDFEPSAAAAEGGILAAWQDIKQPMGEDTDIATFAENAEISVTGSVYKAGAGAVQYVMLAEEEGKFDHSPKLATDGDRALLVWTRSEGLGFSFEDEEGEAGKKPEDSEETDCLVYSLWNGGSWSSPEIIEDKLPAVVNSSVTMNGTEGLLLYTLDMDNNQNTQNDSEIFARIYKGASWGEAVRITDNQLPDSNPKVVCYNGDWFITWYRNGSIMYKEGLGGEVKTVEALSGVEGDYGIALKKDPGPPQVALVYRHIGEDGVRGLSASLYDIENSTWGEELQLTEGNDYVSSYSPAFTEDGKLSVAYTRSEIITEEINGEENKNISEKVDLYMLTYTLVHDLALDAEKGLSLSAETPLPGTMETVTVTVRNQGDYTENARLYLYDGDPLKDGKEIARVDKEKLVPARSSMEMNIEWLVAQEKKGEYDLHVVVLADPGVEETDDSNNTLNHKVSVADIAITALTCSNIAKDDYLITATVANLGGIELSGVKLRLEQGQDGYIAETREIDLLNPGEEEYLSMIVSSAGKINVSLHAVLPKGITENSEDNNKYEFVLEPASIVVEGASPANGEGKVGLQKPLILSFNMNVEPGEEFEKIMLTDDDFNNVNIEKTLEGSSLTVTPLNPMEYGTRYNLTVPAGAVGDSYGHTMEGPYSMSFTITSSSPEIIFAYPGDGMGSTALDTEIKMQFNQKVLSGPNYGDITMYRAASEKLTASLSIDGEWMYIHPAARLEGESLYKLTIPKGAVMNESGEAQQEDYVLQFTTARASDDEDNDGNDNDNDNDSSDREIPGNQQSSPVSQSGQPAYKVSRQVSADGSSIAAFDIDRQTIAGLKAGGGAVTLDMTDEVRNDEKVRVNLTSDALKQLAENNTGLNIVTGKGDIFIPEELVASLTGNGGNSISITIAESDKDTGAPGRVSSGAYDFTITAGERPVTEFASELTVTIPLDSSKVGNSKRVIVCVYDEASGSWQPVGGVADEPEGTVTFRTGHFSTYAAFEKDVHFEDITSSWAKEKVEILASRGLINGVTDTAYNPEGSITRAEFVAMLVRSLYGRLSKSKGTFADVDAGSWYADSVETAYELGLVTGIGENSFGPNVKISREQLAVLAYRLYQYKNGKSMDESFNNIYEDYEDISAYAKAAVYFAAKAGITTGSSGRFEPKRSATRQEAAVVLYRLLEYMGEL